MLLQLAVRWTNKSDQLTYSFFLSPAIRINRAPAFLRRCIRGDSRSDPIGRMLVQPSEVDLAIRRMMQEQGIFIHGGAFFTRSSPALGGMSLEERKDYVANVLRTKVNYSKRSTLQFREIHFRFHFPHPTSISTTACHPNDAINWTSQ